MIARNWLLALNHWRIAVIDQLTTQPVDHAGAFEDFPICQSPRITANSVEAGLDLNGAIEGRCEQGHGFTHGEWPSGILFLPEHIDSTRDNHSPSLFLAMVRELAGIKRCRACGAPKSWCG